MKVRAIGEVAAQHGVPDHVLRHWEDVGALRPERTDYGHRRYGAEQDSQIELIQCGKDAGLSLHQIATLLHGQSAARADILATHLDQLDRQAAVVEASLRLIRHLQECPQGTDCGHCAQPRRAFDFPDSATGARPTDPA